MNNFFHIFKRCILCMLMLIAIFSLFSPDRTYAATGITLNIWDFPRWLVPGEKTDRFVWMNKQIEKFEAQNPGVKVKLTKLTWKRGKEKLKISALGGRTPDIAPGTVPLLFIKENLIAPIDKYLTEEDKADYLPNALDAFKVKGKIYGWPWYLSGQLLYVNRTLFKESGVSLPKDGRWTTEEFTTKLTHMKEYFDNRVKAEEGKTYSSLGYYPLGLYFHKHETANFPFVFAYGGKWISDDFKYAGTSDEVIKGLKWLNYMRDNLIIPKDTGGRTSNDIWTAFGREHRLGAAALGLWGIEAMTKKYPMDFEVVHFPTDKGKISRPFLGISGFYVFDKPDKKRVALSMKFVKMITNTAAQRDLVYYTQFPTRKSASDIYKDNEHMTKAWDILKDGRTIFPDMRWPQIDEEIETAIQQSLLGREKPEEAMKKVETRVNRVLAVESGSIHADIQKGSLFGKIFIVLFIFAIIFAVKSRQIHLIMVIPAITIIGLFLFYPLADAIILAFRSYRLGEVGSYTLDNFSRAWSDPKFIEACKNTLLYAVVVVPVNVFTALALASLIFSLPNTLKKFFRAAYYLPGVASVVVLTMVWKFMFNTEVGLFNTVLKWLSISPVGWLTNPDISLWSVILTGILKSPGGAMLIYMASLANIPKSLYEAADLEGAGPIAKWWHITVPLMRTTTAFMIITGTIASLQVFAQVLMLTDGGPGMSTEVVVHRIYTSAFRDFDFGLSSAMALLLFVVIMIITLVQRRITNEEADGLA